MSDGYFKAIIAADAEKSSLSSAATNNYSNYFLFVYFIYFFLPQVLSFAQTFFKHYDKSPSRVSAAYSFSFPPAKQPKSQSASFIMLWKQAGMVKCLKLGLERREFGWIRQKGVRRYLWEKEQWWQRTMGLHGLYFKAIAHQGNLILSFWQIRTLRSAAFVLLLTIFWACGLCAKNLLQDDTKHSLLPEISFTVWVGSIQRRRRTENLIYPLCSSIHLLKITQGSSFEDRECGATVGMILNSCG